MGREVERFALEHGHRIAVIIDNEEQWKSAAGVLKRADAAIEFTSPNQAPSNIFRCFELNIPVVCGTTGWSEALPEIENRCLEMGQTLFHAPNFSIGVNIFFELNRKLASIMSGMNDYRPHISETHHKEKLDAPSGTAVALALDILAEINGLRRWVLNAPEVRPDELSVEAHRIEGVTGTHTVTYQSSIDAIEMKHIAHNRQGFAEGALLAAAYVAGKRGVFTMKDLLNL